MESPALVLAALFVLTLAVLLLLFLAGERRNRYRQRLGLIDIPSDAPKPTVAPENYFKGNQGLIPLSANITISESGPFEFLGMAIRRAGLRWSVIDILLMCLVFFFAAGLAVQMALQSFIISMVAGLWGCVLPLIGLRLKAVYRLRKIEEQLADAVDMMVAALHAGVALRASMELVRTEMKQPIKEEFNDLLTRIDFGVPAPKAFREWSRALHSRMVDLFAISMASKWDVGGNLSDMLLNLGRRIRESIRLRRRVDTLTAQARLSMIIAYIAPYALGTVLWFQNPELVETLFTNPTGLSVVKVALVMQMLSLVWAIKILRIED